MGPKHTHADRRSPPGLVAAFVPCPCHVPVILAILGTGALGGVLVRKAAVMFVALTEAFAFALWRYVTMTREQEACPACIYQGRQTR